MKSTQGFESLLVGWTYGHRNEEQHKQKVQAEADQMFKWVREMFKHPTHANTKKVVQLFGTPGGKIIVGLGVGTDKIFNWEVMEKLVDMFNALDGYTADYYRGNGLNYSTDCLSYVTIRKS